MPIQRTLFGRPIRLQLPPRRFQILFATLLVFLVTSLLLPNKVERRIEDVKDRVLDSIPDSIHRTLSTAHKPPVEANSTHGNSAWFSDWKWKKPWSATITLDENRAVLPPLKNRPFVYTYYEPKKHISKEILAAEEQLLLVWRRAWWAQGFRPIVLGHAEAMNNPLYARFRLMETDLKQSLDDDGNKGLQGATEYEVLRWLAWGHMGTGVLMNWLALPMAPQDDYMLKFLRRGEFTGVTHFQAFGNNLFCGDQKGINALLSSVLDRPDMLTIANSVIDAAHQDYFDVDQSISGIALYDIATIQMNYLPVAEKMTSQTLEAEGLAELAQVMNAHLHTVWQNTYKGGIVLLKPLKHMTTLVEPAANLAKSLRKCSPSPMSFACPPNLPACKVCDIEGNEMTVSTTPSFRNNTRDTFFIGSVPHPYTATSLHNWQKSVDLRYVRRETKRDVWLKALTKDLLGTAIGSSRRIVKFKEAVAGEFGARHSLWLTAERESHKDLNWFFGFDLPVIETAPTTPELSELDQSALDVPGDSVVGSAREPAPGEPQDRELAGEREMLHYARSILQSTKKEEIKLREGVEAWNLADTEAWRFARAYSARRRVERLKWEEEEHKFAGSEKNRGRWSL